MAKRKLNFNDPRAIRASLATVANMVLNDEIDAKKANCIVYVANGILNSIRVDEQEQRIEKLEGMINAIEGKTK